MKTIATGISDTASNCRPPLRLFAGVLACLALAQAAAQQSAGDYTPRRGQQGKDVMWLPTPRARAPN